MVFALVAKMEFGCTLVSTNIYINFILYFRYWNTERYDGMHMVFCESGVGDK